MHAFLLIVVFLLSLGTPAHADGTPAHAESDSESTPAPAESDAPDLATPEEADLETHPYLNPSLRFAWVQFETGHSFQALFGAEVGVGFHRIDSPTWRGQVRFSITGVKSLNHPSWGMDTRLGFFFGPENDWARLQLGPDLVVNRYGKPDTEDYVLPVAFGLSLPVSTQFKITKGFGTALMFAPSWNVGSKRRNEDLVGFDEYSAGISLMLMQNNQWLAVGLQRSVTSAGVLHSVVLAGGL
jgi:hypothetical protein